MPLDGIAALFYRTPQEHLNGMWKIIKRLPPSPPPRSVPVCTCAQVVLTQFTFPRPIHDVHTDTSACMSTSAGHPAATKPSSSCATARSWGISRSIGRVGWRWHGSRRGGRSRGARWVVDAGYGWSRVTDGIAFLYPLCSFFRSPFSFPLFPFFPPSLRCSRSSIRVDGPILLRPIRSTYPRLRSRCSQNPKASSSSLVRPIPTRHTLSSVFIIRTRVSASRPCTEPTPSEGTIAMRHLRLRLVTAYDNVWMQLHDATLGWLADTIGLWTTVMSLCLCRSCVAHGSCMDPMI